MHKIHSGDVSEVSIVKISTPMMIIHLTSNMLLAFITLGLVFMCFIWSSNVFLLQDRAQSLDEQIRYPSKFSNIIQPDDEKLVTIIREEFMEEPSKVKC